MSSRQVANSPTSTGASSSNNFPLGLESLGQDVSHWVSFCQGLNQGVTATQGSSSGTTTTSSSRSSSALKIHQHVLKSSLSLKAIYARMKEIVKTLLLASSDEEEEEEEYQVVVVAQDQDDDGGDDEEDSVAAPKPKASTTERRRLENLRLVFEFLFTLLFTRSYHDVLEAEHQLASTGGDEFQQSTHSSSTTNSTSDDEDSDFFDKINTFIWSKLLPLVFEEARKSSKDNASFRTLVMSIIAFLASFVSQHTRPTSTPTTVIGSSPASQDEGKLSSQWISPSFLTLQGCLFVRAYSVTDDGDHEKQQPSSTAARYKNFSKLMQGLEEFLLVTILSDYSDAQDIVCQVVLTLVFWGRLPFVMLQFRTGKSTENLESKAEDGKSNVAVSSSAKLLPAIILTLNQYFKQVGGFILPLFFAVMTLATTSNGTTSSSPKKPISSPFFLLDASHFYSSDIKVLLSEVLMRYTKEGPNDNIPAVFFFFPKPNHEGGGKEKEKSPSVPASTIRQAKESHTTSTSCPGPDRTDKKVTSGSTTSTSQQRSAVLDVHDIVSYQSVSVEQLVQETSMALLHQLMPNADADSGQVKEWFDRFLAPPAPSSSSFSLSLTQQPQEEHDKDGSLGASAPGGHAHPLLHLSKDYSLIIDWAKSGIDGDVLHSDLGRRDLFEMGIDVFEDVEFLLKVIHYEF